MPTRDEDKIFLRQYARLSPREWVAFKRAVRKVVHDLGTGTFRKGLRVQGVRSRPGFWEVTWAADGRTTFEDGESLRPGDPHVIWRRVGGDEIFEDP
jgi:hypothetical protein